MKALSFLTGFNHGAINQAGGGLCTVVVGTPTFSTTIKRGGTRSAQLTAAAQAVIGFDTPGSRCVAVIYVYLSTLPTQNTQLFQAGAGPSAADWFGIGFDAAAGKFCVASYDFGGVGAAFSNAGGPTVVTNTWYRLELNLDVHANPWTLTAEVAEGDGAATQLVAGATFAKASGTTVSCRLTMIPTSGTTGQCNYTDWAISNTAEDYPIGPITARGYSPSAVGTHNLDASPSAYFFKDVSTTETALTSSETTSYQVIDDVPFGADSDHLLISSATGAPTAPPGAVVAGTLDGRTTSGAVSPTMPTHVAGDLLIVAGMIRSATGTMSTPNGWFAIPGITNPQTRGSASRYYWWYKIAASASETFSSTNSGAIDTYAQAFRIRGVDTGTPFDVDGVATTGTADPAVCTGLTTATVHSRVVILGWGEDNTSTGLSTTATSPATLTQDAHNTTNVGADASTWAASAERATAGATGNVSADFTGTLGAAWAWGAAVLAIRATPAVLQPTTAQYVEEAFADEGSLVLDPYAVRALIAARQDTAATALYVAKLYDGNATQDIINNASLNIGSTWTYYGKTFLGRPILDQPSGSDTIQLHGDIATGTYVIAQSFTGVQGKLAAAILKLATVGGTPTDGVQCTIETSSGGFPSGTVLATSSVVPGYALSGTATDTEFTFATPPNLDSGTTYWLCIRRTSGASVTVYYNVTAINAGAYASGFYASRVSGSGWSSATPADLRFLLKLDWTVSTLNGTTLRFGYTNDADGRLHLEAAMLEVAFSAAPQYKSLTDPRSAETGAAQAASRDKTPTLRLREQTGASNPTAANYVPIQGDGGTSEQCAQTFALAAPTYIAAIELTAEIYTGSPADELVVDLYSGANPTSAGSLLATSAPSRGGSGGSFVRFPFATPPLLDAGNHHFVIRRTGARDTLNYWKLYVNASNPYASGSEWVRSSSSWTENATWDAGFRIIEQLPSEIGAAQTLSWQIESNAQTITLTPAGETGTPQALSLTQQSSQQKTVTASGETGAAQTLSLTQQSAQTKTLDAASSTDSAVALTATQQAQSVTLTAAASTGAAVSLSREKQASLSANGETGVAASLLFGRAFLLTAASSTDSAQAVQPVKNLIVAAPVWTLDDFNRADEDPLASGWANMRPDLADHLALASGQVKETGSTGGGAAISYWTPASAVADPEVEMAIDDFGGLSDGAQFWVNARIVNPGGSTWGGYEFAIQGANGRASFYFESVENGSGDGDIDQQDGWAWGNDIYPVSLGDKIRMRIVGNRITCSYFHDNTWTTIFIVDDERGGGGAAKYAAPGYVGFEIQSARNGTARIDDYAFRDWTVPVGATEADAAQALSYFVEGPAQQEITISPAAETGAAQTLAFTQAPQTESLTVAAELDAAQTLATTQAPQTPSLSAAAETDAAQTLALTQAAQSKTLTVAAETDAAQGLGTTQAGGQTKTLTAASESGTAQTLAYTQAPQTFSLTVAAETDTAQGLGSTQAGAQTKSLTATTESDAAQTLARTQAPQTASITAAGESGAAQTLAFTQAAQTRTLTVATESDAAQALTFAQAPITRTLTPAAEADLSTDLSSAQTTTHKTLVAGHETNAAQAVTFTKQAQTISLQAANSANTAAALSLTHQSAHSVTLQPASTSETARTLAHSKQVAIQAASTTSSAQPVTFYASVTLPTASEHGSATALSFVKQAQQASISGAAESGAAQTVSYVMGTPQSATLTTASETDVARALVFSQGIFVTLGVGSELDTATAFTPRLVSPFPVSGLIGFSRYGYIDQTEDGELTEPIAGGVS